ncbi:pseudouridine synthase [Ruminococcus flavefaciens]|uniref:Pseudouridine synthase n=1 Tax=Ruminococcus flavefaciens TaxID=1265 RepID=A0A1M7G344_RUMFL|nr:pseudouridine synthase [Ruminococcus flavefaciens]SHM10812.1 16S rRNA pseudouridine516 synthase [Ruminococcus flavefaciens]
MAQIRLDKFISERTEYTRSQIKELAAKGMIRLDGAVVKKSDTKIDSESSEVEVCGQKIGTSRYKYILLNKPQGYVCSTDEKDGETVLKLIPPEIRTKGMFPAGRLDKDSIGALLITDDGELAHKMLSPKHHIPKIYIVKLARPFENNYINKFEKGIVLADGEACLPARLQKAKNSDRLAFVELYEGKYHQVKRMFAAVGNHVELLMRVSLGSLVLPEKLAIGECMELLHKDVENLFKGQDFEVFCSRYSAVFSANLINNHL